MSEPRSDSTGRLSRADHDYTRNRRTPKSRLSRCINLAALLRDRAIECEADPTPWRLRLMSQEAGVIHDELLGLRAALFPTTKES